MALWVLYSSRNWLSKTARLLSDKSAKEAILCRVAQKVFNTSSSNSLGQFIVLRPFTIQKLHRLC